MDIVHYNEARKIWQRIARTDQNIEMPTDAELHARFLNIFQVGSYYHYIFNCITGTIESVSDNVHEVLGYKPDEFSVELLLHNMHPDDLPYFMNFEHEVVNFFAKLKPEDVFKYKVRYDYRVKTAGGNYIRLLQQVITIQSDDNGAVLRTMGVHTDITYLKAEGVPQLSFIGSDGAPSYHNVAVHKVYEPTKEILTRREKQVLSYMVQGYKSKEIADIISISKQTVVTHRRNMLNKTGSASAAELVMKALREGWI
ncbi:LuxR C-terminal-related transcriptional regulator [Flavobacterium sp. RHBU_24]|uniref:LuxR C-terminal-related transcriptional regulator n=1 Tax=Flavobacterium sp. RHBU_24 TaxID=3391185 RepID=UPI0039853B1E